MRAFTVPLASALPVLDELRARYPDIYRGPAFRRGYERGRTYQRGLVDERRDLQKSA